MQYKHDFLMNLYLCNIYSLKQLNSGLGYLMDLHEGVKMIFFFQNVFKKKKYINNLNF